jgi:hypothetical protein
MESELPLPVKSKEKSTYWYQPKPLQKRNLTKVFMKPTGKVNPGWIIPRDEEGIIDSREAEGVDQEGNNDLNPRLQEEDTILGTVLKRYIVHPGEDDRFRGRHTFERSVAILWELSNPDKMHLLACGFLAKKLTMEHLRAYIERENICVVENELMEANEEELKEFRSQQMASPVPSLELKLLGEEFLGRGITVIDTVTMDGRLQKKLAIMGNPTTRPPTSCVVVCRYTGSDKVIPVCYPLLLTGEIGNSEFLQTMYPGEIVKEDDHVVPGWIWETTISGGPPEKRNCSIFRRLRPKEA